MNILDKNIGRLNRFQQKHRLTAFIYAVIQKSNEDDIGHRSALLTYYGFLALFPLLLLLSTFTKIAVGNNPDLEKTINQSTTDYFPVLGNQLYTHIHGISKSGPALLFSILFILYGTRGVADTFRSSLRRIWQVPKSQKDSFWTAMYRSFGIIIVGGIGFVSVGLVIAMTNSAGTGIGYRTLSVVLNILLLFLIFTWLNQLSLPKKISYRHMQLGAIVAAVGLVILQYLGVYILTRELKNLDALYSYFALALGLMFWIYLQAQIIYFAAQVAVVSDRHLWPRSLDAKHPTDVDNQLKDA